jgi:hypothetical protein
VVARAGVRKVTDILTEAQLSETEKLRSERPVKMTKTTDFINSLGSSSQAVGKAWWSQDLPTIKKRWFEYLENL